MVIVSTVLHVVVAVVLIWGPLWLPARTLIHLPVYQVQLVSLPVDAPRKETVANPEPPAPVPQHREPPRKLPPKPKRAVGVVKPSPVKGTRPASVSVPPPATPKRDQEPRRTEPTEKPPQNQVASVPHGSEPGVSMTPTPQMEAVALQFPGYMKGLERKIYTNWSPPGGVETEGREVLVAFTIMHDGDISGPVIEQSSGDPFYDQAALRAVNKSKPFPPFPPGFPDETFKVYFTFLLNPNRLD